ncbi:unnamed protein product, partial [Tenebrio molitor]
SYVLNLYAPVFTVTYSYVSLKNKSSSLVTAFSITYFLSRLHIWTNGQN